MRSFEPRFPQAIPARGRGINSIVSAVSLAACAVAGGQITNKNIPPPPPQAVPAEAVVERWGEVAVPLRIAGVAVGAEFRIRSRPAHGELGEPVRADEQSAVLIYRHTGGEEEKEDGFSYSVKSSRGLSAPARVTVRITDPPPQFAAPPGLDFGEVIAGEGTEPFLLEIKNEGGGSIEGRLEIPDGWRLAEGEPAYRIGARGLALFALVAAPETPGDARGIVRYSSHPEAGTELRVRAIPPLAIEPERLELAAASPDLPREGRLTLINRGARPAAVRVEGEDRLELPAPFEVPADGRTTVTVSLPASDAAGFSGTVRVLGGGGELLVPVVARGQGPLLRAEPARIAFGRIRAGETGAAELVLTNRSPAEIEVRLVLPEGVSAEEGETVRLASGESEPVLLRWKPELPGVLRGELLARSEAGEVSVPLAGELLAKEAAVGEPVSAPSAAKPSPTPTPAAPVEKLLVRKRTTTAFELAWEPAKGAPEISRYRIERARLRSGPGGKTLFEWVPLPDVEIVAEGGLIVARAGGFSPGEPCTMRIALLDPGDARRYSAPFQVQMNPLPKRGIAWWAWALPAVAAVTGGLVWWRKRRAGGSPGR